jgi:hypothetical protein
MNTTSTAEQVASALLYEGYLLYPYRRSALKNRQRFNFGVLYPEMHARTEAGADPCRMRTECLLQGEEDARIEVHVRFLHLFALSGDTPGEPEWHDAVERDIGIVDLAPRDLAEHPREVPFAWPSAEQPGRQRAVRGRVELGAECVSRDTWRLRITVVNLTPVGREEARSREELLLTSLISTHTILRASPGEFVSLIDPPDALKSAASACANIGTWPVLAGEIGTRTTMLSSPIIVYDYPSIAPESPGDFFDGTEMDEMLSLRILTLTEAEKRAMAATDHRARQLLERTERLGEADLMRLHGVLRHVRALKGAP